MHEFTVSHKKNLQLPVLSSQLIFKNNSQKIYKVD